MSKRDAFCVVLIVFQFVIPHSQFDKYMSERNSRSKILSVEYVIYLVYPFHNFHALLGIFDLFTCSSCRFLHLWNTGYVGYSL
jgi:hypothetical protein